MYRNSQPDKVLKGSSALIEGFAGSADSDGGKKPEGVASRIIAGVAKTGGDVLENQPTLTNIVKNLTADGISVGSTVAAAVSNNQPQIVETASNVVNALQGLFG